MPLEPILDGRIWEAHHWLDMPIPGVYFDCRMTLLALEDGDVLIHSPIPIDEAMAAKIDDIGKVRLIIAPNKFHHFFFPAAASRYAEAARYGAPGLAKKREDIDFQHTLCAPDDPAWPDEVQAVFVEGIPELNEVLFYHAPTKTLIVTDLLFNMHTFKGAMSPWVFRAAGTYKRLAQSRLLRAATRDRAAYARSLACLNQLDFERLIMAHGDVLEGPDVRERTLAALNLPPDTSGR